MNAENPVQIDLFGVSAAKIPIAVGWNAQCLSAGCRKSGSTRSW
jgi:hypothetical protein